MKLLFYTIIFSLFFIPNLWAQNNFEKAVDNLLQQTEYKNASIGIHVTDSESGESLYGINEDKLMIPASTLKLITSASTLQILGPDYRFVTKIGYIGETEKNNTLQGNLVLIGGGDPVLGSEDFQNHYFNKHFLQVWAQKIKATGIQRVDGDLILDGSIYDSEKVPATWIWEDIGNYYGAGANAFTVYDNLFKITFRSPKQVNKPTKITSIYPKTEGLQIQNEVLSSDTNSDQAYVFGSPFDKKRVIRGTIPKNRRAFTIKAAMHNPEEILANDFYAFLAKEGIFITGEIKFEKVNQNKFQTIYLQESPPLSEIIKVLNYKSINRIAEHLVKQIAFEKTGIGNREKGIEIIRDYWKSQQISTENIFIEDGSGLSHFNAVSPKFFTGILNAMSKNEPFLNSLPNAGDGTLSQFNRRYFPEDVLKAKSGSMTRVRSYAGYLTSKSEKKLTFSIIVNHFSGSHLKLISEIEKLLESMRETY